MNYPKAFPSHAIKAESVVSDRLCPENRLPKEWSQVPPNEKINNSLIRNLEDLTFDNQLYQSLINGVHPDTTYLQSCNLSVFKNMKNKSADYYLNSSFYNFISRRCKHPLHVLKLTDIPSDFYVHPIDWSDRGVVALTRNRGIIVFCPTKSTISYHFSQISHPASLCFNARNSNMIEIGSASGNVYLCDMETNRIVMKRKLSNSGNSSFLSVIRSLKSHELTVVGDHTGSITLVDLRTNFDSTSSSSLSSSLSSNLLLGNTLLLNNNNNCEIEGNLKLQNAHRMEICNIVSNNQNYIASGGNDNMVKVWDVRYFQKPFSKFNQHSAAVRGMAWNPNNHNIIATGGGSNDRTIRIWDVNNSGNYKINNSANIFKNNYRRNNKRRQLSSNLLNNANHINDFNNYNDNVNISGINNGNNNDDDSNNDNNNDNNDNNNKIINESYLAVKTGSQICNLYWSNKYNLLLSTHGFSQNTIALWKGTDLSNVACFSIHKNRVLYMAVSPDEENVLTTAPNDQTYLWNFFASDISYSQKKMFSLR